MYRTMVWKGNLILKNSVWAEIINIRCDCSEYRYTKRIVYLMIQALLTRCLATQLIM